jgi:hypothetical protein
MRLLAQWETLLDETGGIYFEFRVWAAGGALIYVKHFGANLPLSQPCERSDLSGSGRSQQIQEAPGPWVRGYSLLIELVLKSLKAISEG